MVKAFVLSELAPHFCIRILRHMREAGDSVGILFLLFMGRSIRSWKNSGQQMRGQEKNCGKRAEFEKEAK